MNLFSSLFISKSSNRMIYRTFNFLILKLTFYWELCLRTLRKRRVYQESILIWTLKIFIMKFDAWLIKILKESILLFWKFIININFSKCLLFTDSLEEWMLRFWFWIVFNFDWFSIFRVRFEFGYLFRSWFLSWFWFMLWVLR